MPKGVSQKRYAPEFKKQVVETMRKENLNCTETADRFGIRHKREQDWERIYLTEGPEGLYIERRGRASTGRPSPQTGARTVVRPAAPGRHRHPLPRGYTRRWDRSPAG